MKGIIVVEAHHVIEVSNYQYVDASNSGSVDEAIGIITVLPDLTIIRGETVKFEKQLGSGYHQFQEVIPEKYNCDSSSCVGTAKIGFYGDFLNNSSEQTIKFSQDAINAGEYGWVDTGEMPVDYSLTGLKYYVCKHHLNLPESVWTGPPMKGRIRVLDCIDAPDANAPGSRGRMTARTSGTLANYRGS